MTSSLRHLQLLSAALLVLGAPLCDLSAAVVETTWDNGGLSGWQGVGEATVTNDDAQLLLEFEAQSSPSKQDCLAWTEHDSSFFVTNLSFRIFAANRTPSALSLVLSSHHSGLQWRCYLDPPTVGEWHQYTVPVTFPSGWTLGPGSSATRFHGDKQDVAWIGVAVTRAGATEEQQILVDDFVMEGAFLTDVLDPPDDADGDGMPDSWEDRHSLASNDPGDGDEDSDGDGMSNYAEYRAGTDPRDDASVFLVNAAAWRSDSEPAGVAIGWDSVRYRSYAVWKSTNLLEGFSLQASGIPTTPPHNTFSDTSTASNGACFYRVVVE